MDPQPHIVYGKVIDAGTGQPIEGAAFTILQAGVSTQDWIDSGFNMDLVISKGVSDSSGQVYLDASILEDQVYSMIVAQEYYQVVRYENVVVSATMTEPTKITIRLTRK